MNSADELLQVENLLFGYPGREPFTSAFDFELHGGEVVALMGENGCGKSTLLKTFAGLLSPRGGTVLLCGRTVSAARSADRMSDRERARLVALVRMGVAPPARMTVREFVSLGRTPYSGILDGRSAEDEKCIFDAMDLLDVSRFADRAIAELSDGERSRVFLAQAVAREVRVLLLDEPNAFLDIPRSHALFRTLRSLAHDRNMGIVVSTHSLEYAERYSDRILVIDGGALHAAPASNARAEGLFGWTGEF
ncbi:ABC transporter ATP-binding protein [Fibrobacter sp. UBA2449]|uniref:ABC transporter ATP-binding protein n=1 Tax=Fibrobacter sp. UBA2449 TaxID=1946529 RepID=UPI0025BF5296|nr:ABC transporter ATP-binding protein [Fibrobacter sp. UBA2449]